MAGAKKKRSTNVATKRKRSSSAKKGWETRRAREAAEEAARERHREAARQREREKRRKERERLRILEEARATVARLKRRTASAIELAKETTAELREARDRNVPRDVRNKFQDIAVETADRAYEESRELNAAVRVLAKLEGEKTPRRKSVTRAARSVEDALHSMMMLAAGASDGPTWGRMRAAWYDARKRLMGACGSDYEQFIDTLNRIAEATETDWQIAYGP